jgi:ubiquinone/menaquinone biosynthesis C-methylase UbiE
MMSRRAAYAALTLTLVSVLAACGTFRSPVEEASRIAELLHLAPGMSVADVGAGYGEFSEQLATRVGKTGRIYATEIDEELLDRIGRRMRRASLENVELVLGDENSSGLQKGCCDAIILRLVYHHLTQPAAMRASLREALRAGGLLMIIDVEPRMFWPAPAGVPERSGGHGILPSDLIEEMVSDGFEKVEIIKDWNGDENHYSAIFRRL